MSKQVDIDIEHADNYMQHIDATTKQTLIIVDRMKQQVNGLKKHWTSQEGVNEQHKLLKIIQEYEETVKKMNALHKHTKQHSDHAKQILDYANSN
ncbi:hypothetical protein [Sulfurimonas sp. HSL3-7]|uniref:hypothetical protein n=1 Tax=Sulfonitrofixus jiaomeiensis TaxID=3131938 RepID=UPI0031F77D13